MTTWNGETIVPTGSMRLIRIDFDSWRRRLIQCSSCSSSDWSNYTEKHVIVMMQSMTGTRRTLLEIHSVGSAKYCMRHSARSWPLDTVPIQEQSIKYHTVISLNLHATKMLESVLWLHHSLVISSMEQVYYVIPLNLHPLLFTHADEFESVSFVRTIKPKRLKLGGLHTHQTCHRDSLS